VGGAIPNPRWTDAPPTANSLGRSTLVNPRIGSSQPPTGWGPPQQTGWAPLVDPGPLHAVHSITRWLWPTVAVGGFLAVTGFVLAHDDPTPGLSIRGLATVTLAAAVVGLLTLHRRYGPRPLARALGEYAVVLLLAVLITTTGVPLNQPPPTGQQDGGNQASAASDQRPALVKTIDHFGDWLAKWRAWAHTQTNHPTPSPSTTSTTRRTP
jgi:hypothetical protein